MLVELGAYTAVSGGILGIPRLALALNTMRGAGAWGKLGYHATMMAVEEVKMAAAGFTPGTGAAFYSGGVLTRGWSPFKRGTIFNKRFGYMEPVYQKVIKAGPVGAVSSQLANVASLAYQDLMDNKDFKTVFDAMYGDLDQTAKDILVESIVFSIVGGTHLKGVRRDPISGKIKRGVDLMTTTEKEVAIQSIIEKQNEILAKRAKSKQGKLTKKQAWEIIDRGFQGEGLKFFEGKPEGYENLTNKQREKYDALEHGKQAIQKMQDVIDMAIDLDPRNEKFEENADRMVFKPAEEAIKAVVPEWKGFEVRYESNPNMYRNKGAVAEFVEGGGKEGKDLLLFNKNHYTPGKSIHEIAHAALRAKFSENAEFKMNFDRKFVKKFGEFEFGEFKGTELYKWISENYGTPVYEVVDGKKRHKTDPKTGEKEYNFDGRLKDVNNLRGEEFLMYMTELLADPKIYKQVVAKNIFLEMKNEFQDMYEETFGKRPKIRTAKEFVAMLGRMSQSARRGLDFSTKLQAMTDLDKMDFRILEYEVNRDKKIEKEIGLSSRELKKDALRKQKEFEKKEKDDLFKKSNDKLDNILKDYYNIEGFSKMNKEQQAKEWGKIPADQKLVVGYMLGNTWKKFAEMKADINYGNMGSLWTTKRAEFIEKLTTGIEKEQNGLPYLLRSWKPEESKLTSYIYGNLTKRFGHTQRTIEGFGEQMVGMEKAGDIPTGTPTAVKIKTNKIDKNLDIAEKSQGIKLKNHKFEIDGKEKKFSKESIENIDKANEAAFIETKEGELTFMQITPKAEKATIKEINNFLGITPGMKPARRAEIMNDFIKNNPEIAYDMILEPYTKDFKKIRMYETSESARTIFGRFMREIKDPEGKIQKFTYAEMPPTLPKKTRASQPVKREKIPANEKILDEFVKLMTEGRDATTLGKKHELFKTMWAKNFNSQSIRELRTNSEARKRISKTEQGRKNLEKLEMEETLAKVKGPMDVALATKLLDGMEKAFRISPELAKNIFVDHALNMRKAENAKYHRFIDSFKDYEWYFKNPKEAAIWAAIESKAKEGEVGKFSFVKDFNRHWDNFKGELPYGLTGKDIKGINSRGFISKDKGNLIVDVSRLKDFLRITEKFGEYLPKEAKESLVFLDQILGLHYRITLEGMNDFVRYVSNYKAKSPKGETKSFTEKQWKEMDTKGWEIIEKPGDVKGFVLDKKGKPITDQSLVGVRERILKVLGKNTYEGFKDIKSWKIKSAATQAEGQKKMAEAGDNYVKQLEIAEKYFSEYDNQTKKELSFNIESAKEQFIKDAKNKKEALERIEWVYQIIRANSNLRMGLRQTVPVEWIYMPGEKVTGEKIKLEHMKSMIEHGTQSGHLIATGKFRETGKDITSDFIGVTSVKKLLDIVDNAGGTTNTSGLYRMALLDPMTLMDFKSAKDPKKTMYQAIMDMANKELFNGKINQQLKIEKNVEKNIDKLLKPALSSKNLSRGEKEKAIKIIDNAVDVGRERNKTRKGGSFWDLDDTLFRTKSGVRYTLPNPSGKPAPQKKVIFMAGGPGSGKSTVIKGLGLEKQGFKIVNQDISLEWLMKNHGLPKDMRDFTPEQASKFGELGWEARMIAKRKQTKFQGRGDGIIVDGTGNSLKTMQNQVREFKNKGYDVQMLFVETSLETALQRNKARKERSLRSGIVKRTHESVQKNKQAFIDMFGKNFTEIKTDNLKQGDPIPKDVVSKMDAYTKGYKKGRFTAEEFAIEGERILAEGGKFDFSEFDYIKEGTEGPLFNKAMERAKKFGTEDTYILTARPHAAKVPIFRFLEARGLKIPFKNIITLENSAPEAKALEIAKKIGEGYNDIYFADDVLKNVQAVKNIMDQFDIKGKVQQAMASLNINAEINRRMEHSLGIDSKKTFTRAEAKVRGKDIKRRRFFMTDSASDLELLIEPLYGKGKKGIENKKWLDKNFIDPFERGIRDYNTARQNAKIDYMSLRKQNKDIVKKINKPVEGTSFTHDMAMRVYLWNKAGYKIPDLAKTTEIKLVEYIKNNPKLQAYAESFARMTKIEKGLKEPSAQWWAETMAGEISNVGRGVNRKQYLQEWIDIKNEMFSPKNLNKMESKLGTNWRENIEDIFDRMETGRTRSVKLDKGSAMMIDYLNGSTGTIMNFNTRSAALQTISTLNFLNMRENNPIAAARAMGNAPQFAKDFMKIMNSDMLKQRRDGLQINVSEAELASAAATSKNPITSIIAKILKVGYTPTKLADSFAISFGGATYYRNRIKMYEKQGLSAKEAEAKAWTDFQKLSERTQQSSRPDLLSKQQTTIAGRLILPFANTPMQMNRRGTKEILDISKGRYKNIAELGEKMGKITYYMGAQVALFAGLQSALFAMLLNDDDVSDEKIEKTKVYTANTVADSFLRGMGIPGAVAAGFKNATLEYFKQSDKGYKADYAEVAEDLLNISPLIGSKYSALDRSGDIKKWDKDVPFAFELGNPKLEAAFLTTQALTNIPLQSWHQNASNIQHSLNTDYETWQRIHMMWGFTPYNVGIEFEKKKETKKRKSRKTRGVRKTR
jgi:predicted kinase